MIMTDFNYPMLSETALGEAMFQFIFSYRSDRATPGVVLYNVSILIQQVSVQLGLQYKSVTFS